MTRIVYVMLLLYVVCSYNHVSCTIIVVRHMWTLIISLKHVYVMHIFQTLVLLFHTVLWPSVYVLIKTYISHWGFGLEQIYAKETIMNNIHVLIDQHVIFYQRKVKVSKGVSSNRSQAPFVSLSRKLYLRCSEQVVSRNGFERDLHKQELLVFT